MSTDAPSSCGRGGARKKEESVPTGLRSRPCSAAAKDVGILNREICGGQITGDFQTASYLLQQTIFEYTAALNSMRDGPMGHGFDCGDGSCIDWHQRHVVRVFSALSSGCLVYGAFVAAVAAMVSVLAWACLGCSFLAFCL